MDIQMRIEATPRRRKFKFRVGSADMSLKDFGLLTTGTLHKLHIFGSLLSSPLTLTITAPGKNSKF